MYLLATKRTGKQRVEENTNLSFLRHRQPRLHWFVACYIGYCYWLRSYVDFGQSRLSGLSSGAFINSARKNRIGYQLFVGLNFTSAIGYHSNSWPSCYRFQSAVVDFIVVVFGAWYAIISVVVCKNNTAFLPVFRLIICSLVNLLNDVFTEVITLRFVLVNF